MFTVRKATENDSVGIASVDALIRQRLYSGIIPDEILLKRMTDISLTSKQIRNGKYGTFFSAIDDNGTILGYANCGKADISGYESFGEIYNVAVIDNYRLIGVGTSLIEAGARELAMNGFENMIVRCFCDSKAGAFFTGLGGYVDGRVKTIIDGVDIEYEIYRFDSIKLM